MFRIIVFAILATYSVAAAANHREWAEIEIIVQRSGTRQGDALKLIYPRTDLPVRVDGVAVDPALCLVSWMGFRKTGKTGVIVGEIVLRRKEAASVIRKLEAEGLTITAVHKTIPGSRPEIVSLHFRGDGDMVQLVWGVTPAFSATGMPMGPPVKSSAGGKVHDWKKVEAILGQPGEKKGNILHVTIPRREKRMEIEPLLGAQTELNFQPAGKKTAVAGTFVLLPEEVDRVTGVLVRNGISVTAVHDHALSALRLRHLHFWGVGDAGKLAQCLKAAIDLTAERGGDQKTE